MFAWLGVLLFVVAVCAAVAVGAFAAVPLYESGRPVELTDHIHIPTDAERHAVMLPAGLSLHTDWRDAATFLASDGVVAATVRRAGDLWIADAGGRPRVLRTFLYAPCEAAIRATIIQCDLWSLRRRAGIGAWADPTDDEVEYNVAQGWAELQYLLGSTAIAVGLPCDGGQRADLP